MKSLRFSRPSVAFVTRGLSCGPAVVVSNRALDDWPQWRGPNRDGRSAETGLLKDWPAGGPPLAWRATGAGEGYSSFARRRAGCITLGARGSTEYVIAFDAATRQAAVGNGARHPVQQRSRRWPARDADDRGRSRLRVRRQRRPERARRRERQDHLDRERAEAVSRVEHPVGVERIAARPRGSHPGQRRRRRSSPSRRPTGRRIWTTKGDEAGLFVGRGARSRQRHRRRSSSRARA